MTLDEIRIGDNTSLTKTITLDDIIKFVEITGDTNPLHTDPVYAKSTRFGENIVPGLLVSGIISGVIGSKFPGYGTIYVTQTLAFLKPVKVNETITAKVEVIAIDKIRNRIKLKTICYNSQGSEVLAGEATVIPPK